jgi:hypothetical protein
MENLVCYPGIVFYAPGLYDLLILSASATEKGAVIIDVDDGKSIINVEDGRISGMPPQYCVLCP